MKELQQHMTLLLVVISLVMVKFIFMPLYEWQLELQSEISLLNNKVVKSQVAINNASQVEGRQRHIEQRLNEQKALIYSYDETNRFQLARQKWLEKLFLDHEILIHNLGWQPVLALKDFSLLQHEVRVHFESNVVDLQKVQLALERHEKWINNNNFNYRFNDLDIEKVGLGKVSGRASLRFYMEQKP
ncbi:hypothetical protein CWB96_10915 [Pseudoalteromonas citrea]|uniref:Uncharacterized protein n=1 Tax=Pseudoalteromonas citrea TaxID=43655 RepID=A0A5S3XR65_9GAMM|nr:hypothetical protein [Pseudoalteromonas citrea]TMP45687.1 hypothetical protein CWB97_03560 [Pseudoalteromonas citrea]TMP59066.1 hypothetical protein CWB96_10915 [Pseudoalteromonas citrea]